MRFSNGLILTIDNDSKTVDYLATTGNLISEMGSGGDKLKSDIDLAGKTLLPGFIDTHLHLLNYGFVLKSVNLRGCRSIEELKERVLVRVRSVDKGAWIFGKGWDENLYGGVLPSKDDLDQISPHNPVVLSRVCGHLLVLNSQALRLLNIDESVEEIEGGAIDRDESGHLTGVFREKALDLVHDKLPPKSMKEIEAALIRAGESVLSQGITTVHTDDLADFTDIEPIIELYRRLQKEGKIPQVHLHLREHHLTQASELGLKTGLKLDGVTIGSVKIFADGSLGARTAALIDDYNDAPGDKGILIYQDEEIYQIVKNAQIHKFAVAIHGIGDQANEQALRTIAKVQTEIPKPYFRHRLVHAQILNETLMDQLLENNVIAEIQPIFINTDLHWAEKRVGARIKNSYNWQTLWQKGIHLSGSSDCPVEPVNPLWGIYSAVARKDLAGMPIQGWYPDEALTLSQALQLFTTCGAYTGVEENEKGKLALNYQADLVVLDHPIDQVSVEEIKDIKVIMTIINGEIVYQA